MNQLRNTSQGSYLRNNYTSGNGRDHRNVICYGCSKRGYIKPGCPKLQNNRNGKSYTRENSENENRNKRSLNFISTSNENRNVQNYEFSEYDESDDEYDLNIIKIKESDD